MRPAAPLSAIEQLWAFLVAAISIEGVIVFAFFVLFVVGIVFAVTLFAKVFCCRS